MSRRGAEDHGGVQIVYPTAAPPEPMSIAGSPLPMIDRARLYVCGITPYDVTHLGHAATYVWVDVLTAVLADSRTTPIVCRNVTDIDDVLSAAADRAGTPNDTFAYLQQYHFDADMAALRVSRPHHEPRARHHISQVVALAAALVESGAAYVSEGSVYLPGTGIAESEGLSEADALALAAEYGGNLADPAKRQPLDAALWQASTGADQRWDSPWGPGRPGWHAGCTAMVLSTFGLGVDIHAGGADLRYPHHAFEAAIGEALTGVRPYARRWFRVGVVNVDGVKMAKSVGNLVLVRDLLADHSAGVIRTMLLDRPWSESWQYDRSCLVRAADRLEALRSAAGRPNAAADTTMAEVRSLLRDDLRVSDAVDVAIDAGGQVAERLMALLKLE